MKKYILIINTGHNQEVEIAVIKGDKTVGRKKFAAKYKQAEMLLPEIDKMLKKYNIALTDIIKIKVANTGGSFTALRIGVVTANALCYALGVPVEGMAKSREKIKKGLKFSVIEPIYNKEPNITQHGNTYGHHTPKSDLEFKKIDGWRPAIRGRA